MQIEWQNRRQVVVPWLDFISWAMPLTYLRRLCGSTGRTPWLSLVVLALAFLAVDPGSGALAQSCPRGSVLQGRTCVPIPTCQRGQELFNGACVPVCPSGQTRNRNGQCVVTMQLQVLPIACPPGQVKDPQGQCVPCSTAPPQGSSGGGTSIGGGPPGVGTTGCAEGGALEGSGQAAPSAGGAACPPGMDKDLNGQCVTAGPCGVGTLGASPLTGTCLCLQGYTLNPQGICVAGPCGPNEYVFPLTDKCECLPFYKKNAQGVCVH